MYAGPYDDTDFNWWRDGQYKSHNYAYFEDPEKYYTVYIDVLKGLKEAIENGGSIGLIFPKIKAILLYSYKEKDSKVEKNEEFNTIFKSFVDYYIERLIRDMYRHWFFKSNLGYVTSTPCDTWELMRQIGGYRGLFTEFF